MNTTHLKIENKVPLRGLSTFKIGGNTSHLFVLENKSELKDALEFAKVNNLPVFILGGGSNILFSDKDVDCLVIKISNKGKEYKKINDTDVLVTVGAGEGWDEFVAWTIENGFYGLENLSAIPGTVGASPVQNIGAYGVEVKDYIDSVEVFDMNEYQFKTLSNPECEFGYRHSIFKTVKNMIVVGVKFKLQAIPKVHIEYKDLSNYFKDKIDPSPNEVRDAVISIRAQKFPDLSIYGTAGSFFKNILCKESDIRNLKTNFPDLPVYNAGEGIVKISTAYVLDKVCGLKGFRIDNVGLFENQSLVVVNYGNATAEEVKNFIAKIKNIVEEKTGIKIEEEVVLVK